MPDATSIGPTSKVRLHLSIHLEDGTEALSSLDDAPLDLHIGDGTLAPGLETLLIGLQSGADEQTLIAGSAVFGEHDPSLVQHMPHSDLPHGFNPEPGQIVSFETPGGQETSGTILSSDTEGVEVDFNHPLSNRSLLIRVQVLAVA
jgi:FKBP-type peptidyl-prolyl cis-trans isomerase SlpA